MNGYKIPYIEETHNILRVYAPSLKEAIDLFKEQGPRCGVVTQFERIEDSQTLDLPGIMIYNHKEYPVEVDTFAAKKE